MKQRETAILSLFSTPQCIVLWRVQIYHRDGAHKRTYTIHRGMKKFPTRDCGQVLKTGLGDYIRRTTRKCRKSHPIQRGGSPPEIRQEKVKQQIIESVVGLVYGVAALVYTISHAGSLESNALGRSQRADVCPHILETRREFLGRH